MKKISILFVLFSLFSVRNTQPFIEPVTLTILAGPALASATVTMLEILSKETKADDEFATIEDSEEANNTVEDASDDELEEELLPHKFLRRWKLYNECSAASLALLALIAL